jgi:hypothetical protein
MWKEAIVTYCRIYLAFANEDARLFSVERKERDILFEDKVRYHQRHTKSRSSLKTGTSKCKSGIFPVFQPARPVVDRMS